MTSLVSGVAMSKTSAAVRVSWPAATDAHSAIAGYEVQVSRNGGAWGGTVSRTATQRDATYTLAFDTIYQFRVRAVDAGGNWSPWVAALSTSRVHPYDDRSTRVSHTGSWSRASSSSAYKATLTGARAAGAKIGMTFTGHAVAIVSPDQSPSRQGQGLGRRRLRRDRQPQGKHGREPPGRVRPVLPGRRHAPDRVLGGRQRDLSARPS